MFRVKRSPCVMLTSFARQKDSSPRHNHTADFILMFYTFGYIQDTNGDTKMITQKVFISKVFPTNLAACRRTVGGNWKAWKKPTPTQNA